MDCGLRIADLLYRFALSFLFKLQNTSNPKSMRNKSEIITSITGKESMIFTNQALPQLECWNIGIWLPTRRACAWERMPEGWDNDNNRLDDKV